MKSSKKTAKRRAAAKSDVISKKITARTPPPMKRPPWKLLTADTLEQARKARGMSKAAWSRHLGVGVSTYWNWLKGLAVPPISKQRRLLAQVDAGSGLRAVNELRQQLTGQEGAAVGTLLTRLAPPADVLIQAVQAIMVSMASQGQLPPERAAEIARELRRSLSGQ